jgi:hypothetical protein
MAHLMLISSILMIDSSLLWNIKQIGLYMKNASSQNAKPIIKMKKDELTMNPLITSTLIE